MPVESTNRFEVRKMKIIIEATPEETAKLLQAIASSKEQQIDVELLRGKEMVSGKL